MLGSSAPERNAMKRASLWRMASIRPPSAAPKRPPTRTPLKPLAGMDRVTAQEAQREDLCPESAIPRRIPVPEIGRHPIGTVKAQDLLAALKRIEADGTMKRPTASGQSPATCSAMASLPDVRSAIHPLTCGALWHRS